MSSSKKTAIVTGGSRGLGRGIVEALAAKGLRVVVVARDKNELSEVTAQVPGTVSVVGDATDEQLAEKLLQTEQPDLIVLCVGAPPVLAPLHEQTWESFATNWSVDTKSTFVWLRQALRLPMKKGGHIIVISSGAAIAGSSLSGGYAAAKKGQWFITEYAKDESERAQLGLRFHCLLPNLNPSTGLGRAAIAAYAARSGLSNEEFAKRFSPPLTPAIIGEGVVNLFEEPEKWNQLLYRIGGKGLAPLN